MSFADPLISLQAIAREAAKVIRSNVPHASEIDRPELMPSLRFIAEVGSPNAAIAEVGSPKALVFDLNFFSTCDSRQNTWVLQWAGTLTATDETHAASLRTDFGAG